MSAAAIPAGLTHDERLYNLRPFAHLPVTRRQTIDRGPRRERHVTGSRAHRADVAATAYSSADCEPAIDSAGLCTDESAAW